MDKDMIDKGEHKNKCVSNMGQLRPMNPILSHSSPAEHTHTHSNYI